MEELMLKLLNEMKFFYAIVFYFIWWFAKIFFFLLLFRFVSFHYCSFPFLLNSSAEWCRKGGKKTFAIKISRRVYIIKMSHEQHSQFRSNHSGKCLWMNLKGSRKYMKYTILMNVRIRNEQENCNCNIN